MLELAIQQLDTDKETGPINFTTKPTHQVAAKASAIILAAAPVYRKLRDDEHEKHRNLKKVAKCIVRQ